MKIAVYGTLRRGFSNYEYLLAGQLYLGEETLELPFKMISLGGFPGLIASNEVKKAVVEVFDIDDEAFRSVDSLEGYPRFYNRRWIHTSFGKAWIYYLEDRDYYNTDNLVPDGDWKKFINKKSENRYEILSED